MFNIILVVVIGALVIYALKRAGVGSKGTDEIIADGDRFLAENGARDGVTQTASGLQYEVIYEGAGERHPEASERVLVHYHGTLIDETVFDSSVNRGEPISFGLNQVISGWTEGVQLMTEGGKYRFFIPASLGYGNRKTGSIPGGSVLIFDVELIKIG